MPVAAASSVVGGWVSRGHVDAGCSGEQDRERESWVVEEQATGMNQLVNQLVVAIASVVPSRALGSSLLNRAECR